MNDSLKINDYSVNNVVVSVFTKLTQYSKAQLLTTHTHNHCFITHTPPNPIILTCYQLNAGLLGFLVMGAMLPLYK